ncbi:MAG: type II toxin-antitoxin system HicA family toxin [Armatimonadota bacterium]
MASGSTPLRNKSSADVVRLLEHFGFARKRRGPHDTYEGFRCGGRRTAQVPRSKKNILPKTLSTILTQACIDDEEARAFWGPKKKRKAKAKKRKAKKRKQRR